MAIGAIVGKASKGSKKVVDNLSKKERIALKLKKDAERKAARAATKTAKKEAKQKVAVVKPQNKEMMGGNKPLVTVKPKAMSRSSAGPKRMEKEVKGEVVSSSNKLKGGDPKSPKSDAGTVRKGGYKKAAAIGGAGIVGAGILATSGSNKKAEAPKPTKQPKAAASKPTTSTATAASSPGKKSPSEFGSAFKAARKAGKEVFEYKGKKYHSYTKEEVAKMSPEEKKAKRKKGAYV